MSTEYKHPVYIPAYSKSRWRTDVLVAKIKNQISELW